MTLVENYRFSNLLLLLHRVGVEHGIVEIRILNQNLMYCIHWKLVYFHLTLKNF